jgi:hypothetical protein
LKSVFIYLFHCSFFARPKNEPKKGAGNDNFQFFVRPLHVPCWRYQKTESSRHFRFAFALYVNSTSLPIFLTHHLSPIIHNTFLPLSPTLPITPSFFYTLAIIILIATSSISTSRGAVPEKLLTSVTDVARVWEPIYLACRLTASLTNS